METSTQNDIFKENKRDFHNDNPKISVIGVGAGGSNIITDLFTKNLKAHLTVINTDWKQLSAAKADKKLLIGLQETRGRGAGGDAILGRAAAKESSHEIKTLLEDTELIFLIGGLGNGTATGGLPFIAQEAKKRGALVVAFLIIPFFFRKSEIEKTQEAIQETVDAADTVIVFDQNKLLELYKNRPFIESFSMMNTVIDNSIDSLISLIRDSDLLDVDFSHIKKIFSNGGFGAVGIGQIPIYENIEKLIETSLNNKLFHFEPKHAKNAIVHVIGGETMTLSNLNKIAQHIKEYITEDAEVIVGAKIDHSMKEHIKAVVILSGLEEHISLDDHKIRDIFQSLRILK